MSTTLWLGALLVLVLGAGMAAVFWYKVLGLWFDAIDEPFVIDIDVRADRCSICNGPLGRSFAGIGDATGGTKYECLACHLSR